MTKDPKPDTIIDVQNVSKQFRYAKRHGLRGLLRPEMTEVTAVDNISLRIKSGESVAFIGPNGAGKSTTIKMLCGILRPSQGTIRVLGMDPLHQRRQLAYRISTVFGQRSQLIFNLPLTDTLELTADMYALDRLTAKRRISEVIEQFNLDEFIHQPVRKLSLGQRMRAEVANSMLHNPDIIFLDEPTIGLDVVAKRALRDIIRTTNKKQGTAIFLTSHDAGDIEEVSDRAVIINHGRIMLDVPTDKLKQEYLRTKVVKVVLKEPWSTGKVSAKVLATGAAGTEHGLPSVLGVSARMLAGGVAAFEVDTQQHDMQAFLPALLKQVAVDDVVIEDVPLEDIIHELYVRHDAGTGRTSS